MIRALPRIAALAGCILLPLGAAAGPILQTEVRHITVTGEGEVTVEPDIAKVELELYLRDKSLIQAKLEAARKIERLVEQLSRMGMQKKHVRTAGLSVSAKYTAGGKDQEYVGYADYTQTVLIHVPDLNKLDAVLDTAFKTGINTVKGITLGYAKEVELRTRAMQQAVVDANLRANTLAASLGIRLGRLHSVELRKTSLQPSMQGDTTPTLMNTVFIPEPITARSEVEVTFELAE